MELRHRQRRSPAWKFNHIEAEFTDKGGEMALTEYFGNLSRAHWVLFDRLDAPHSPCPAFTESLSQDDAAKGRRASRGGLKDKVRGFGIFGPQL